MNLPDPHFHLAFSNHLQSYSSYNECILPITHPSCPICSSPINV
jgi:hypothetical protein